MKKLLSKHDINSKIKLEGNALSSLKPIISADNEQLARSGMNCLENLVMGTGKHFREDCWVAIVDTITQVLWTL